VEQEQYIQGWFAYLHGMQSDRVLWHEVNYFSKRIRGIKQVQFNSVIKVKVHPITGPEGPSGGVEVQLYPSVSLGTRRGWGG
jgi:hypothetical protein